VYRCMVLGLDQNPRFEPIVALHDLLLQLASANRPQAGAPFGPSNAPREQRSIYWGFSLHIPDISSYLIDGQSFPGRRAISAKPREKLEVLLGCPREAASRGWGNPRSRIPPETSSSTHRKNSVVDESHGRKCEFLTQTPTNGTKLAGQCGVHHRVCVYGIPAEVMSRVDPDDFSLGSIQTIPPLAPFAP
jgi:hypothetical protein